MGTRPLLQLLALLPLARTRICFSLFIAEGTSPQKGHVVKLRMKTQVLLPVFFVLFRAAPRAEDGNVAASVCTALPVGPTTVGRALTPIL